MYRIIEAKQGPARAYSERCRTEGIVTAEEEERFRGGYRATLKEALAAARSGAVARPAPAVSNAYRGDERPPGPPEEVLRAAAARLTAAPPGFHLHPRLQRILAEKADRLAKDGTVDWAFAESLAFASLLREGVPIRLSGQDSSRGTFSQRHLVWWDHETPAPTPYTPLATLAPDQAPFAVHDSPLSEYSVLGFEYGYSLGQPRGLTLWEAQYGDFSNGGQVITDNYLAAGEAKWGSVSGLVLLLPHGFEGQGPEHSSGHLERFLALAAGENLEVANCTTPAQYFHLLRRQALGSFRKPLAIMTPKSLLRHPRAVSTLADLSGGSFREVLDDPSRPGAASRVLFCSGKVYYDLVARRGELGDGSVAIVRVEQLAPFPRQALAALLDTIPPSAELTWVQEEPRNRGAWVAMKEGFDEHFGRGRLGCIGRPASASPATGSKAGHDREQAELLQAALPGEGRDPAPRQTAPATRSVP
jgi:2-oxoglutarate dehydrogenase E1 component